MQQELVGSATDIGQAAKPCISPGPHLLDFLNLATRSRRTLLRICVLAFQSRHLFVIAVFLALRLIVRFIAASCACTTKLAEVDASESAIAHSTHATHAAHPRHVIVVVRYRILLVFIHPLNAIVNVSLSDSNTTGVQWCKRQLTLSKSVLRKCTFLPSFNNRGQ